MFLYVVTTTYLVHAIYYIHLFDLTDSMHLTDKLHLLVVDYTLPETKTAAFIRYTIYEPHYTLLSAQYQCMEYLSRFSTGLLHFQETLSDKIFS